MANDDDLLDTLTQRDDNNDKSARMVVRDFFDAKNNADLKTHLSERETLTFAKADFYSDFTKKKGFKETSALIDFFSDRMMRKRFSFNRMSRAEFGEGLKPEIQQQMQEDRNKMEKILR